MPWQSNPSKEVDSLIKDLGGEFYFNVNRNKKILGLFSDFEEEKTFEDGNSVAMTNCFLLVSGSTAKHLATGEVLKVNGSRYRVFRLQKIRLGELKVHLDKLEEDER